MTRLLRFARQNVVFLVVLALLVGGFLLLKQDSSVGSAAELDAALQDGRPTVLELFSNT
jgi:hypothetical protein